MRGTMLLSLGLLLSLPSILIGQTIADAVRNTHDGTIRMSYEAREDVCYWSNNGSVSYNFSDDYDDWCDRRPIRVTLVMNDGRITDLDTRAGGRWRRPAGSATVTDLGEVDSRKAARYFMELLPDLKGRNRYRAVEAAALARDADIWPDMIQVARSDSDARVRRKATFWLSREARHRLIEQSDPDRDNPRREDQKAAVFALSQLRDRRGTDALVKVARTHRDPYVRSAALFWLSQKETDRALDLIEEILGG